ncbi:MAG TPA: DUF4388 domain-containing protein, partial [Thermoanaerobaculia bacterium]|nr:DUF4388 domain-containing protein [Thermoanaerobaculia bacterium]
MTLERLEKTPFTTILGEVLTERRTGRMNLVSNSLRRTLFWSQGELVLVLPEDAKESLGSFLLERQIIEAARVRDLEGDDPTDLVCRLDATEAVPASQLQSLLRQWTTALTLPLFSLEEGTVAFASEEALDPEKRIYVSTPAVVLAGIRQIGSGMVLRASLGDLSRQIEPNPAPCYSLETLPLTEVERKLATKLRDRQTLADLLKSREADSATVSRVTLAMITLGSWSVVEARPETVYDDVEKDLATLAALAGDERALRVVAYARQLQNLDHYQVLDVPRAATRQQIVLHAEELRRKFQRSSYPAAAGDAIQTILNRVEEAVQMLTSPEQRHVYDRLLATAKDQGHGRSLQQQIARRSVAIQN